LTTGASAADRPGGSETAEIAFISILKFVYSTVQSQGSNLRKSLRGQFTFHARLGEPMRLTAFIFCFSFMCLSSVLGQPEKYPDLKVGDDYIDFLLPYATKDSIGMQDLHLATLVGPKLIVLAFYPADWSGGCTKEVCTMRDNIGDLSKLNADVIAISGDYVYSHHEWAKFHTLPFILGSDHKHEVAAKYKSFNESTGYNKRTVYVIDTKGKIAYFDLMYSTKDLSSFTKLQDALKRLQ
jgi:peroxiredoxin